MNRARRVFITGASGYLGTVLLKTAPKNTQILAQFCHNPIEDLSPGIRQVQMDFRTPRWDDVIAFRPEVVIHTAAVSNLDECEAHPATARDVNYRSTAQLVEFALPFKARFVYVSTDQVFNGEKGDYSEKDSPNPINTYGQTKLHAERFVLENHPGSVSVRSALIYGNTSHRQPSFTESMIARLREGRPVNVFRDEYRSPVFVETLARCLWELSGNDYHGPLNIGGGEKLSRYRMGKIVCAHLQLPANLLVPTAMYEVKFSAQRPADLSMNVSFAAKLLNTNLIGFSEGAALAYR